MADSDGIAEAIAVLPLDGDFGAYSDAVIKGIKSNSAV